jgi:branched-chain amino acid aminotransferase
MTERVIYLNGAYVPQSEAKVSVLDWGFSGGDGVYEATRTFGHELFRLDDHLDRLDRSLAYIRIDPGMTRAELAAASRETVARNVAAIGPDDEFALWHVITRGDRLAGDAAKSTVVMYCLDVEFAGIARHYLDGVRLVTPGVRRTPPQCADPKAKLTNRMNQLQAKFEAAQADPEALPLLLDIDGNIAESNTANFFFVSGGRLCTSTPRNVLGGITRLVVFELARDLGIEVVESDFTPYDVYSAEEAFLSGTSGTISPVTSLNAVKVGSALPGPVTMQLIRAWNDLVGLDFVAQALRHLGDNERGPALAEWERRLAGTVDA